MAGPVPRTFDRAEHDGRVRPQSERVCDAMYLTPLPGIDLVRADDGADLVVQDLGRGTRKRREPRLLQLGQEVLDGDVRSFRSLPDLECGEGMYVHVGDRLLDGAQVLDVVGRGERVMD